jgi:hypothetical protein
MACPLATEVSAMQNAPLAALRRGYTTLPCVWKGDDTTGWHGAIGSLLGGGRGFGR